MLTFIAKAITALIAIAIVAFIVISIIVIRWIPLIVRATALIAEKLNDTRATMAWIGDQLRILIIDQKRTHDEKNKN